MVRSFEKHEQLNPTFEKMIEECFVVGKLAEDGQNLPRLGADFGKAVSYRDNYYGNPSVVFYIEALSTEPELLQNMLGKKQSEFYISFDDKNKRYLERLNYSQEDDKPVFLRKHFENRLILFKPVLSYERKKNSYHYNLQIILDEKIDNDVTSKRFLPIPYYTQHTHQMFESRLVAGQPVELKSYNHAMEIPQFILCGDFLYYISEMDAFQKFEMNKNTNLYFCAKPEAILRIPKPEDYDRFTKLEHKGLAFVPLEQSGVWVDECNEEGKSVAELKLQSQNFEKSKSEVFSSIYNGNVSENDFIQRLDYLARKKKLRYRLDDLYNFHISLKTSRFTILGGMSGTGKTQLAMLYAEALKKDFSDNLLFVPVKPSFTDPSDLFGFLNPQTGVYHESDVGLISFLYKASQFPDQMHMILFDEMNLGQVEHYLSDFISVLELEKGKKVLQLFNGETNCVQPHLKEGIPIGENVLFVGTANFDETTRDFSNRMLDRSNVIILEKLSFLDAKTLELEDINSIKDYETKEKTVLHNPEKDITSTNFNSWIDKQKSLSSLNDKELSILDNLHEEISNYDSQTGVSFRIAKQIGFYLTNIPEDEEGNLFIERSTAFDYQIKQRILTKIRGHKEQIENLVGRYDEEYRDGSISSILNDSEMNFDKSIDYLKQKAKELKRNGYTL